MPQVDVALGERAYSIHIATGLIDQVGRHVAQVLPQVQSALIITDTNVMTHYGERVKRSMAAAGITATIASVPAGESSKSLSQAADLYTACVGAGLDRSSVIVALGGGVVGDLAGFVAATYMRGIPFVQVPTSLLAQVDSSVGGKTGVDLPAGKNLVGAFHQPVAVLADVGALLTLPAQDLSAGMGEVIKHAVIRDAALLEQLEEQAERILRADSAVMIPVIATNCQIKATVVAADEREGGLRAILNFGHTVGHALETHTGWQHGECIAVGMLAATELSLRSGYLQEPALGARLTRLLQQYGLPTRLPLSVSPEQLITLMQVDKKRTAGKIHWVLPVRVGEVIVTSAVEPDAVYAVLEGLRG
jgi:3-dehydroquinate synthase